MTAPAPAAGSGALGGVAALWRYPASSLGGESLDALAIDLGGVDGDRLFGLIDAETAEIARPDAGVKWHGVPRILARLASGGLEVRVPGGYWLSAPGAAADQAASDYLGFSASIRRYEAGTVPGEPRYQKDPIHLLTTASLAELESSHPGGDADPRRFRPNIVVDIPAQPGHFPETEWIGRRLAVGEVELTVTEPCRRCGFTIIAQDSFDNDPDILRTLVRRNRHNLGVYCAVDRPGTVRLGDRMRFLD